MINLITHKERKGAFKNFDALLKFMLKKDFDYFVYLQDDFIFDKNTFTKVENLISDI